jgi:hypothetical protein
VSHTSPHAFRWNLRHAFHSCPLVSAQIYCDETPFDEQPSDYRCPQCNAPKRRFARFNVDTGKVGGLGC